MLMRYYITPGVYLCWMNRMFLETINFFQSSCLVLRLNGAELMFKGNEITSRKNFG